MCNQKFTTLNLLVAKCLSVSKKYYFLRRDDLADAVWKGRMLCTGNCIKGGDGKMVWNMDALYAAPVDLHNACLVVLYGALHGVFWQADVKSAYLQPARGGNVAWLRLPAFLVDLPDFVFAQNFVARFASKCTVAVDKRLEKKNRIFGATLHFRTHWQVHPVSIQPPLIHVDVDADHGCCLESVRSTRGWNVFVTHGHSMLALVHWASRRKAATARSTGEAERVAGADCARSTFPVAAALEDFVCFFFPVVHQLEFSSNCVEENYVTSEKSTSLSKFRYGQHS